MRPLLLNEDKIMGKNLFQNVMETQDGKENVNIDANVSFLKKIERLCTGGSDSIQTVITKPSFDK